MIFTILLLLVEIGTVELVAMIAAAILAVLLTAGVFGAKLAPLIKEIQKAVDLYGRAKAADSPGGEKITKAEREKLKAQALDILEAAWNSYGQGVLMWIAKKFKRG